MDDKPTSVRSIQRALLVKLCDMSGGSLKGSLITLTVVLLAVSGFQYSGKTPPPLLLVASGIMQAIIIVEAVILGFRLAKLMEINGDTIQRAVCLTATLALALGGPAAIFLEYLHFGN